MAHKIADLALGLLFALFAYFQLNDPDPVLWVIIYTYIALMAFGTASGKPQLLPLLYVGLVGLAGGVLWLAPSVWEWVSHHNDVSLLYGMSAERPYIEESRECLGLLIALLAMLYFVRQLRTAGQA